MPNYYGGHQAVVGYALETLTSGFPAITESTDGTTPATLPTAPSSYALVGYLNRPQTARGLNNSKGFSIGTPVAAYNKRGRVAPTLSIELRAGSLTLLTKAFAVNGALPYLCFFVIVPPGGGNPGYTDIYRYCKIASGSIQTSEATGEGNEVTISLQVEAMCRVRAASPLNPDLSALNALGNPLFFHDLRALSITNAAGTLVGYRDAVMSFSCQFARGLERKGERPDWGDNSPLSRTCYDMLEHTLQVSGEMGLHKKVAETLFTGATNAMDWQQMGVLIQDVAAAKSLALTIGAPLPTDETDAGVDASAQQTSSIGFVASGISATVLDGGVTTTVSN